MSFMAIGGWLGWILGGYDGFLYALIIFMIIDYITGISPGIIGAGMLGVKLIILILELKYVNLLVFIIEGIRWWGMMFISRRYILEKCGEMLWSFVFCYVRNMD